MSFINRNFGRLAGIGIFLGIVLVIAAMAAWLTHVLVCIKAAAWLFLIAGAIAFPIGIIHGVGIWFGVFCGAGSC